MGKLSTYFLVSVLCTLCLPTWAQEVGGRPERPVEQPADLPILKVPSVTSFVEADYPAGARAQGLEATVGLAVEIDSAGLVQRVDVLRPAGHGFDESASAALLKTTFTPAENADGPLGVVIEFDYNFVLDEEATKASDIPVNLEGTIRRMGERTTIAGVNITVMVQGVRFDGTTDDDGHFEFRGLPQGIAYIQADAPGYDKTDEDVRVDPSKVTALKLWLRPITSTDEDMVVEATRPEPDISRRTITVKEIKRIPGTFGDPVRVIQNLPGTARAPFGTGLVVVRGSNPEDTAFYVDGIRVPLIYHLGGLVSIINEDLVGSVDYLPGGYGVEYGRSTGGVININTSSTYPENFRAEVSVDLLDSSAVVQGRAGKEGRWGLTAAGRRSYLDVFLPLFTRNSGFTVKPYWWDYQIKVDDLEKDNGRFTTLIMGFGDKLFFGSPDNVAQGTDQDTQGDGDVHYGAHRVITQYAHQFDSDLTARVTPSIGYDEIGFGVGDSFTFTQKSWLFELRSDLLWDADDWLTLRPGVDMLGGPYRVKVVLPFSPDYIAETDPLAEREGYSSRFDGTAWSATPFVEAWVKPIDGTDTLKLIPGVRFNSFILPNYSIFSIDPRLAVRYSPFENTTVKGGTGIYHQPPQGPDLGFNQDDITVDYEKAWSSEVGIEQQLSAAVEADVTVFYKKLSELIVENEDLETNADPYFVNGGEGRVRGLEVMLRHNPMGRFFGWISYTLSRAERYQVPAEDRGNSRPEEDSDWRPFEYDQTHILVALAGFDLPHDWGVSGRFRYVTGNPYTPYENAIYDIDQDSYFPYQGGDVLSDRLPPFMSLDLRADKRFTFKHWWLEAYVDLMNVVRGENPESLEYNYDYTETAYIRGLPFLPSPGVRAEVEF
jgi:TonB family protein